MSLAPILSACNTASGDGSEGAPGLTGLAPAFYAGARAMLASHWPVRGDEGFTFIGGDAFGGAGSTSAGQLRAFNVSGNLWQVEADTNGDGNADLVIQADMTGPDPLNAGDFLL